MVVMTADGVGQQMILQRASLLKAFGDASLRNVNSLTVDSVAPFLQTNAALIAHLASGLGPRMMTPSGNPRRRLAGAHRLPSKRSFMEACVTFLRRMGVFVATQIGAKNAAGLICKKT